MNNKSIINEIMDDFSNLGFLSHNYGPDGRSAIGMWKEEQCYFIELLLQAPEGNYAEIGSFCGGSACLMGLVKRYKDSKKLIHCVDINFNAFNGAFRHKVYKLGKFKDLIFEIELNSKELNSYYEYYDSIVKKEDFPEFSFVFDDGFHSYKAVIQEFEAFKPYLMPGAIFCFHDTEPNFGPDTLAEYTREAYNNHVLWMAEDIPDVNTSSRVDYHKAESLQNFRIGAAIAHILKENTDFELLEVPTEYECNYEHIAGKWKLGSTSPNNAIRAIRKRI